MFKTLKTLVVLLYLIPALAGASISQSQKLEDFEQLNQWIQNDYGPLHFKEKRLGLDVAKLYTEYKSKITPQLSEQDFYYHIVQYMAEFRDSHSKVTVPSDYAASLGFGVDLVQGKVLIDDIDRALLPQVDFPFQKGDEVLAIDSVPVDELTRKLKRNFGMSTDLPARRIATFFLTKRGEKYVPVPTGLAQVTIRSRATKLESSVSLKWVPKGTPYSGQATLAAQLKMPIGRADLCAEKSSIEIPANADVISDVPFTAYSVPTAKGRVGFIRIPHYYPVDPQTGFEIAATRFQQYERVIQKFEAETNGLIIDQNFNCGGSVLYLHKMLSLFVRHPFDPLQGRFRASQTQVDGLRRQQLKMAPTTDGYDKFKYLIDEIDAAKENGMFMTKELSLWGFLEVKLDLPGDQKIVPNPIGYTKPILMLVNEMSGSGGDVFPAMMQDNDRAVLMGHTTMGAAGHLWDDPKLVLKNSGLQVDLTRSLFYRADGTLIENTGVTPEIPYDVTEADFVNGYKDYLNLALDQISRLIQ